MKQTNDHTENVDIAQTWYRTFVWMAVVGGIFSLIACALLISNHIQGRTEEPLESAELIELRTMLREQPDDESLKEQIRVIVLKLREEYFQRHQFSTYGAYLLIGGVTVFLIGIKSALTFRKKLPMPQAEASEQDEESRMTKMSRWSMGVFALLVAGGALLLMIFGSGVQYPTASEEPGSQLSGTPC